MEERGCNHGPVYRVLASVSCRRLRAWAIVYRGGKGEKGFPNKALSPPPSLMHRWLAAAAAAAKSGLEREGGLETQSAKGRKEERD